MQDKFRHTTSILNYNLHKALKKKNTVFSAQTDSRIDELSKLIEKIESCNNQVAKEELEKELAFFFLPGNMFVFGGCILNCDNMAVIF